MRFTGTGSDVIENMGNSTVKALRKLGRKKYRQRRGRTLIEGIRVAGMALEAGVTFTDVIFTAEFCQGAENRRLLTELRKGKARIHRATREVVSSISTVSSHQGFVAAVQVPRWSMDELFLHFRERAGEQNVVVYSEGISIPGNLGTIVRSAHAMGAHGYVCSPETVEMFHPRVVRASAGSSFFLPGVENVSLVKASYVFKEHGFCVVATSPRAPLSLEQFAPPPKKTALMLGEEAGGLSPEARDLADVTLSIPMKDEVESLNVAVSAGIVLYHLSPLRYRDPGCE